MTPDQADYLSRLERWQRAGFSPDEITRWLLTEIHGVLEDVATDPGFLLSGASADADIQAIHGHIAWLFEVHQAWIEGHRPSPRGRRPRSGKYWPSADAFTQQVCALIRLSRQKGHEPTEEYIASLLMRTRFTTRNIDSATRMLRRYAKDSGYTWQRLLDLADRPEK